MGIISYKLKVTKGIQMEFVYNKLPTQIVGYNYYNINSVYEDYINVG